MSSFDLNPVEAASVVLQKTNGRSVEKLTEIFGIKWNELRKKKWEEQPAPWCRDRDEYEFQCQFEAYWAEYLNGLNCEIVANDPEELVHMWNYGSNKETIAIVNPEDETTWIFVPKELAEKVLVLDELP